jgi:diguanylate cyclase (GGDEF)-like protein
MASADTLESKGVTQLAVTGSPSHEVQIAMRKMERREWWLWSSAVMVTMLLMIAIASFAFPALLTDGDPFYAFFLNQAVRGLAGLVLLFNVYVVYQQFQINRIRRQVTDQIFAVDKVEVLAQEVYKVAVLDQVTGLFNRRYIEQRLHDEILRSQRHGRPLTAILFDLDSFKMVNDQFGHAAGDAALKSFAATLGRATRGSDVVGRYGGDEFLAVLPECKPEEVPLILKRLEGLQAQEKSPVYFSAGSATYDSGETMEDFLKRADDALYANKRRVKEPVPPTSVPA